MTGPLSYIGGKNRLAKKIVAMFPPHETFCEAFLGGGQVFFRKERSKVEVINDIDNEVVNFFRCVQQHPEEMTRCLKYVLVSREWFRFLNCQSSAGLTDIQRAIRFFYLQKNCYAGLVRDRHYGAKVVGTPGFKPDRVPELLQEVHKRLARVQIESSPFQEFIKRFDRRTTLFYCDPPYWRRKLYNYNFADEDYRTLATLLQSISGKFILSVDDVPELRDLFSWATITQVDVAYTSQKEPGKRYLELIITNFEPGIAEGTKS